ncbi:polysaccharide deacetylase family protein [Prauserella cavernicola]|uniref:Polysaccharide deacetylase family protein n=1 Tax=Prauserella cavernicola TaxID=2800127 RepID=A0A934QQW6_9PSEU|nr:polysaccharide deacetylase family protein [Prauserella cavernicola]MBK1783818.1 polysaccharide deacetylase family protein [Prauserella cavernicola]
MTTRNLTRRLLVPLAVLLALSGCSAAASPPTEPKLLHLTFDDGPGRATGAVLDVLADNDAEAVFFALGADLAQHRDVTRRAIAEGNVVANHSWAHADLTRLDPAALDAELDRTTAALRAVGSTSSCVRPPYGSTNDEVDARLDDRGLRSVLWNVDTEDWRRPGASVIAERLVDQASPGAVVLLHDGGGDRSDTVQALRIALPKLAAQGYEFTTVPGC